MLVFGLKIIAISQLRISSSLNISLQTFVLIKVIQSKIHKFTKDSQKKNYSG